MVVYSNEPVCKVVSLCVCMYECMDVYTHI